MKAGNRLASLFATMSNEAIEFDRSIFSKTLKIKALRIPPRQSSAVRSRVKDHLLSIKRLKSIRDDPDSSKKLVLLNEAVTHSLPEDVRLLTEDDDIELIDYDLSMGYEHLSAMEVMRKLLPVDIVIPSAFETVGHIAHLNLRPEQAPYRHAIGRVLLDKNPSIKTVVNKVGMVENAYRLMELEVIAGDSSLETEVRQGQCRFRLDFGRVYWNSRLEHEHDRLVKIFRPGACVLDLMAGIGPFAIPAAKAGCQVVANDKNPDSYRYLMENAKLNDVEIMGLNLDARQCLRFVLGLEGHPNTETMDEHVAMTEPRAKRRNEMDLPKSPFMFEHVIMNYPQYAIDFLDMFDGAFNRRHWSEDAMPIVHCYAFMHSDEDEMKMKQRCEAVLGGCVQDWIDFHIVRKVSPSKSMVCISFRLPSDLALSADQTSRDDSLREQDILKTEILSKKRKCNDG